MDEGCAHLILVRDGAGWGARNPCCSSWHWVGAGEAHRRCYSKAWHLGLVMGVTVEMC